MQLRACMINQFWNYFFCYSVFLLYLSFGYCRWPTDVVVTFYFLGICNKACPSKLVFLNPLIYWINFSFNFFFFYYLVYHIAFSLCPWPSDVVVTSYCYFFLQQRYSWHDLFDKATKDINKRVIFVTFYFQGADFFGTKKDINKDVMFFHFLNYKGHKVC